MHSMVMHLVVSICDEQNISLAYGINSHWSLLTDTTKDALYSNQSMPTMMSSWNECWLTVLMQCALGNMFV